MISVVMPALNAAPRIALALEALVEASVEGLVKEVVVVDGGSGDETRAIADGFGARVLTAPPGRGGQLSIGGEAARGPWLLFLHADTVLAPDWSGEAARFIKEDARRAGVFTLCFDATGIAPEIVAAGAMVRTRIFCLPYGDQGLLISKALYDEIGGYRDLALMEDVDFIRRLMRAKGRRALQVLSAKAVTSAARYQRDGYARRAAKNLSVLMRYYAGADPQELAREYR